MARKRANGEGSISYEKSLDKYRAAFTDTQGKRIVKRFNTRKEASEWLAIAAANIAQNKYVPASDITLGEWLVEYISTYKKDNVKLKTLDDYIRTAGYMVAIHSVPLQQLTAHEVQKFYSTITLSSRTKVQIHRLLKSAVTKAFNLDMISKNFMLAVDAPKLERKAIVVYTKEEIKKILTATQTDKYYTIYYPMFLTAVTTGMRIGELLGLQAGDLHSGYINVNRSIGELHGKPYISTPKTKAGVRRITISATTEAALRKLCEGRASDDFIFTTKNGTPYAQNNVRKVWTLVQEKAGVKPRSLHAIRHTHATQLIAAGTPIPEVSARLGHSTVSHTLNIYSHAIPNYDTALSNKLDSIFLE